MALNFENVDLGNFGINEEEGELNIQVRANMDEAFKINPDQHAQVTKLSQESGVPEFAVESDPAQVEHGLKLDNIDFSEMSKRSPNTAKYLTDFNNSVIAQDDIDIMKSIEDGLNVTGEYFGDIGKSFEKGQLMVESSDLGRQLMYSSLNMGEMLSDDQIARMKEIEKLTKHEGDERGFFAGAPIAAAEQVPIMYEILRTGLGYAGAGAVTTGAVGLGVGAVTGPGAIPTAIAFGITGGKVAGRIGVAKGAFDLESGLAAIEFSTLKDEKGNLMNPQVAATAAMMVGGINAGLEFISLAALGRTVTPAMRGIIKSKVKRSLGTETGREMMTRLMKDYGIAVGTETVTETAQEFTNVIGAELAKYIDEDSFTEQDLSTALDHIFSGETAERVVEAGKKGAQASLIFAGAGTSVSAIAETRRREKLSENEQMRIDTLNENVGSSKLKERDKESFRQFVEEADGDNNTHVFIDGVQAKLYLQSLTAEEIQADHALSLLSEKSLEAAALGGDIQIAVADFATDFAGTEHYDQLRDSMTMSTESISPFRQEQVQQETESYIKVLMEEAQQNTSEYVEAQEIYTSVREQLIDSGQVNAANASIMAQIVPAWATAQARRSGKSVQQVYQDSGLTIEGPQTGERARLQGEQVLEQQVIEDSTNEIGSSLGVEVRTPRVGKEVDKDLGRSSEIVFDDATVQLSVRDDVDATHVTGIATKTPDDLATVAEGTGRGTQVLEELKRQADLTGKKLTVVDATEHAAPFYDKIPWLTREDVTLEFDGEQYTPPISFAYVPQRATLLAQEDITDETTRQKLERDRGQRAAQQKIIEEAKGRDDAQALAEFDRAKTGEKVTFTRRSRGVHETFDDTKLGANTTTPSAFLGHYLSAADVGNIEKYGPELSVYEVTLKNPLVISKELFMDATADLTTEEAAARRESFMEMGYDGILIKDINWMVVFEGATVQRLEEDVEGLLFAQAVEDKDLFVAHNLSAENILAAEDLGGLAAPSIAVARTGVSDFTGFGEVTLLADPKFLEDPKARTFDADIYSPRQPRAVYDINQDKYSELYQQLDPDNLGLSKPDINSLEDTTGADNLLRSSAVEYHWLQQQGKAPKIKQKKVKPIIRKFSKSNLHQFDLIEDEKFIKAVTEHYQKELDELTESGFDVRAEKMEGWYFNEDGVIKTEKLRDMAAEVNRFRETGGKDDHQLRQDISKKLRVKKTRTEYEQWVSDTFNGMVDGKKLFKGFTPAGNRKYVDYNLQNVVKDMTQQLQAGESFFYGAGTVRSKYANEMKTIKQIQAKREEIISEEDMTKVKEDSADVFQQALEDLKPFYKFEADSFGYSDDVGNAIIEGRKGLSEAFDMTPEAQQIVDDLLEYLVALPTSYFEAKVQRAVGFEEFDTAVVPRGMRKDALQVLKNAGLKIKTYDSKTEGARADAIAKQQKLLFQRTNGEKPEARGYYDPANSIIRLTEAADLSTFLHEFAHFMYEMEVNGDTEVLHSINNWYKRNAEDVANEANEYLNKKFNELKQQGVEPNALIEVTPEDIVTFLDSNTTGDKTKDSGIRRAIHEQFARGFETYLMEGKAPSIELRNAFRAFARWLSRIYQAMRGQLNVDLDAEMRQVFDRLLATDEQIQAAEARAQVQPMFTDAAMAGMTEEEFTSYQKQQEKTKDVQTETLRDKIIKQLTRTTKKWWKEEKQDIIDDEIEVLKKERVYAARERLKVTASTKEFDDQIKEIDAQVAELEKQLKVIKKNNDTLGQFFSKKGGLNRAAFESEGVDKEHFKDRIKVFGKPLFPRKGGMTTEDVAEKLNEAGYGTDLSANEALEVVFDMLNSDDSIYVSHDVTAEIDNIDSELDSLQQTKEESQRQAEQVNIKLDHAAVKAMVGEDKTNKLGKTSRVIPPNLVGMTAKGMQGVHPDEAAAFLGYNSGSEMMDDLIGAPAIKDQAEVNAEAAMIERHGDILTDGTIEREADEAVMNEERGKLILKELKTLAKGTTVPVIDRTTIKAMAEINIGKLSFREIHPGKYRRAEIRAAQEASRMLAEGNREGAAEAKRRQVMNYYLGMAATSAKNETTKIVDRMNRYSKKKVREEILKAENGYLDQIDKILGRFEFRKAATLKEVESINTWMKERMESDGDGLVLSNAVLNEGYVTHWKNIPFSDLQGVNDSVKNIEHVARYANKIRLQQEEIDFKKLKSQWVGHIEVQDQRFETKESRSRIDDARQATKMEHIRKWASQLTKMPFMASWLDGGERVGLSHDILIQPLTDALDAKMKLVDKVAKPVIDLIKNRSKVDTKRHNTKIWIPEINDHLMGHQVLAVALNTGNQSNLKKLLLGEGWANPEFDAEITFDNPQLQAILAHMSKSDWQMVQTIWDQMELLYPQLAEVHRRTTGLTPPKIESTPITVVIDGETLTFRGGYMPVKYSPKRSHKAEKNAEKREAETESMFNNTASIQASVNASATNERTGFYDRIHLSLDVVLDHFNETIHYVTHHDAVRQINRLVQSPDVANAITGVLGEEEFKQIKPWLNDVAKDGRQQPVKTFIDEAFHRLRFGTTLGVMGFKASTGIMQLFGIMTTAAELGPGATMQGIYTTVGRSWYMKSVRNLLGSRDDMQTGWEFAAERSKVMNHRVKTMDREIRNAMERLTQTNISDTGNVAIDFMRKFDNIPYLKAVQEASMKHIALIQTYMVDLPTWHAAYEKELSESGDEVKAINRADWSVENLQGSGATKDMATILRNQSKIHTTFTMFMTFFSSLGNLGLDTVKGARTGIYSPTSVAAKTMFLFTLPVFFEMLMRGELDEPEDEDERLGKFVTATALYPLTSVPFVRDVASGLIGDYGYNSSPVASLLEKGIQGYKQIGERAFTDEEVTKGAIKSSSKLTAAAAGIPGINQVWATGEHLYDVIEDGEDLTVRELLFGPDRE